MKTYVKKFIEELKESMKHYGESIIKLSQIYNK